MNEYKERYCELCRYGGMETVRTHSFTNCTKVLCDNCFEFHIVFRETAKDSRKFRYIGLNAEGKRIEKEMAS